MPPPDHRAPGPPDAGLPTDEALPATVRDREGGAFAHPWAGHRATALAVARTHLGPGSAGEDVVAEVLRQAPSALRGGKGPQVFPAVRFVAAVGFHAASRRAGALPGRPVGDLEELLARRGGAAPVARAFTGLPERSQAVLWHTELEGLAPDRAAGRLGLAPAEVSSLHWDAAGALRHAYRAETAAWPSGPECARYTADLGGLLRGALPAAHADALREHLNTCAHCTAEYLRREDIGHGLRTWVLPVLAGVSPWGSQALELAHLLPAADRVPGRRRAGPAGSSVVPIRPVPSPPVPSPPVPSSPVPIPSVPGHGRPGGGVRALVAAGVVATAAVLVGVGVSWIPGPDPEVTRSSDLDAPPLEAPGARTETPEAGETGEGDDGSRDRSDAGRAPTAEPAPSVAEPAAGRPADLAEGPGSAPVPPTAPLAVPGGEAQSGGATGSPLPADGTPPGPGSPGRPAAGGVAVAPVPTPVAATVPGVPPGTSPGAVRGPASGAASGGAAATAPSSTPTASAPGATAPLTAAPGPASPGAEPSPPVAGSPAVPSTEPAVDSSAPLDEATEPGVPEPTLLEIPMTPWPTLLDPRFLERPGSP